MNILNQEKCLNTAYGKLVKPVRWAIWRELEIIIRYDEFFAIIGRHAKLNRQALKQVQLARANQRRLKTAESLLEIRSAFRGE